MTYQPILKNCEWCGVEYSANLPKRRFCGKSCSGKARFANNPELRERGSRKIKEQQKDPSFQAALRQYLHSERNPFRDPAVREKAKLAAKAKGFPGISGASKGGNGRGPTVPQARLSEALGWPMEVVVSCGPISTKSAGLPSAYKIDVANREKKIAIEVDGFSHQNAAARVRDARKDAFLRSAGWIVLRFSNCRVMEELSTVLAEISSYTTSRPISEITSPTDS